MEDKPEFYKLLNAETWHYKMVYLVDIILNKLNSSIQGPNKNIVTIR